jgi:MoaA/NifB/PqqE/SkfB family radical SAM enzyme
VTVRLAHEPVEARKVLAQAWANLPDTLRIPTQFLGRQYAGCGGTIGVMPRCDFSCRGCYLGADANHIRPRPVEEVKAQMRAIRRWLGPAGNIQLTDGEVTLRVEAELVELVAYAREIGLVPMLMSHGETFRRKAGLLERLMVRGGLSEISLHIDTTMRGRRDGYAHATTEAELDGLRAEFADLIRSARGATGRRLEAASTVTVTRRNLAEVPGIVRWFLRNADAFKMLSFQPVAAVGRTDPALGGVDPGDLWSRIAEGAGDLHLSRGEGYLGHPACSRFVQGLAVRRGDRVSLVPLYRRDRPHEMRLLEELLDRLGGTSFRLDGRGAALRRAARVVARHGGFLATRGIPYLWRLVWRTGTVRARYFCIVSHHFMNAAETASPRGRERLAVCAFRVPIGDRLEPMCAVNALGLRDAVYARTRAGGPPA